MDITFNHTMQGCCRTMSGGEGQCTLTFAKAPGYRENCCSNLCAPWLTTALQGSHKHSHSNAFLSPNATSLSIFKLSLHHSPFTIADLDLPLVRCTGKGQASWKYNRFLPAWTRDTHVCIHGSKVVLEAYTCLMWIASLWILAWTSASSCRDILMNVA